MMREIENSSSVLLNIGESEYTYLHCRVAFVWSYIETNARQVGMYEQDFNGWWPFAPSSASGATKF
jgi:hypothetical protein